MKTKPPFDESFARAPDPEFNWRYQDSQVNEAYVDWLLKYQFNLAALDDYLQEDDWNASAAAQEVRALIIQRRAQALDAFTVFNTELAFAWINFLFAAMRASKRQEFLLPLSRMGEKFMSGRKGGTVSPERGFVRSYLQKYPKSNPAKIFAALSVEDVKGIRAVETQSGQRFIYRSGLEKMSYTQFSNMVHTERKLQGLIAEKVGHPSPFVSEVNTPISE